MESTKVITFRLSESTVKLLDDAVKKHRYWKRNAVVEQLLYFVLSKLPDEDIYDILRTYRYDHDSFKALHLAFKRDPSNKC